MTKSLSLPAILYQLLGTALMFTSTLFGTIVSFISWFAISDGAPQGFIIGPVFFLILALIAIIQSITRLSLLRNGKIVEGTAVEVRGLNIYSNKLEIYQLLIRFLDRNGRPHEYSTRMTEPRLASSTPLPIRGEKVELLYDPSNPNKVKRLAEFRTGAIRITDSTVDASIPGLFVLGLPP